MGTSKQAKLVKRDADCEGNVDGKVHLTLGILYVLYSPPHGVSSRKRLKLEDGAEKSKKAREFTKQKRKNEFNVTGQDKEHTNLQASSVLIFGGLSDITASSTASSSLRCIRLVQLTYLWTNGNNGCGQFLVSRVVIKRKTRHTHT